MEPDILDWKLPKTYYYPQGWLLKLDIIGMMIAPLSFSSPFFLWAIQIYLEASSKGTSYYIVAVTSFLTALGMLIIFGSYFRGALKSYVNHQATRDEVNTFRLAYFGFILGSLVLDFIFIAYLLYGPKT